MAFATDSMSTTAVKGLAPKKGQAVRVMTGKYEGCKGWINENKGDKGQTPKKLHLIVVDGKKERLTCLMKQSVLVLSEKNKPTCFEEAIFEQHPDITMLMIKLSRALAECELPEDKSMYMNMATIFKAHLDQAIFEQDRLGHKAKWRKVNWKTKTEEIRFDNEE